MRACQGETEKEDADADENEETASASVRKRSTADPCDRPRIGLRLVMIILGRRMRMLTECNAGIETEKKGSHRPRVRGPERVKAERRDKKWKGWSGGIG